MRIFNRLSWYLERNKEIKDKDAARLTTREILERRNMLHSRMVEADRKDRNILEIKGWINALDWVLGAGDEKK